MPCAQECATGALRTGMSATVTVALRSTRSLSLTTMDILCCLCSGTLSSAVRAGIGFARMELSAQAL